MSYSVHDDTFLDQNFLPGQPAAHYEDDDILDEFLDQRVYDLNGPSPSADKDAYALFADTNDAMNLDPSFITSVSDHNSVSGNNSQVQSPILYDDEPHGAASSLFKKEHDPTLSPLFKNESQDVWKNGEATVTAHFAENKLTEYDQIRAELSKLKFGKFNTMNCPPSIDVPSDQSYLDFSAETMRNLPYKLQLSSLPDYSRVETQIKISFNISPSPPENLLYIPQDLITKNKFCLSNPVETLPPLIRNNLMYMECFVLTSNLDKSCNICSRCIKREQKRASRRRIGSTSTTDLSEMSHLKPNGIAKNNPNTWSDENMIKKAIIFNCKEIVGFPAPNGLNDAGKNIELSARLICYCRHHKESAGFKLLFVLKDHMGKVVAKQLSSPIMIMDRKKPSSSTNNTSINSLTPMTNANTMMNTNNNSPTNNDSTLIKQENPDSVHPISPNSIDESSDICTNTDSNDIPRNLKRKKLSVDDSNNASSNPMFNGSANGFSPLSNSDTNTNNSMLNTKFANSFHMKTPTSSRIPQAFSGPSNNLPSIQRIIPAQGPLRGGIEITLLGFNFTPGLSVKFGANLALATHCWSETTIVTYLPPASEPGQVLVTFENQENMTHQQQQIFTYTDDTDKQLIELALQIVGLKMNGKLEDAKNIAKRIVGSDLSSMNGSPTEKQASAPSSTTQLSMDEWYSNAHNTVQKLTKLNLSTEEILVNFLSLVDLPNCPIVIPNWQLTNNEGQSLLHLAALKNYENLVRFLIVHGCKIDSEDNHGLTPLFMASLGGHRGLMDIFVDFKANWNLKLANEKTIKDYCDMNVMDVFSALEESNSREIIKKSQSIDSLTSLMGFNYGLHISKMVSPDNESFDEFADSEFESHEEDCAAYAEDDYTSSDDEVGVSDDNMTVVPTSPIETEETLSRHASNQEGLWQKVKSVFNNAPTDDLPNYDELFPFGPSSSSSKPKSTIERHLNEETNEGGVGATEVVMSDSSEDMIISYINHPRKTVENDKMLLFFWIPVLLIISSLLISATVFGYQFQTIENAKGVLRDTLGNLMLGNERLRKVFK